MAAEKRIFPQMYPKNWATIRKRFLMAKPPVVTPSYLESIGIPKDSIRSVVIPTLRRVGLVDDEDKPTDLVVRWRDDSQYPEVCNQMLHLLYPEELLAIAPNKDADKGEIQSWFGRETGAGKSAAGKMANFYMMLLEADPSDNKDAAPAPAKPAQKPTKGKARGGGKPAVQPIEPVAPTVEPGKGEVVKENGAKKFELHFDIQIHISPESSPEQIDKIFKSMADHLKSFVE